MYFQIFAFLVIYLLIIVWYFSTSKNTSINNEFGELMQRIIISKDYNTSLCYAAYAMDMNAIEYLLYKQSINPSLSELSILHCLMDVTQILFNGHVDALLQNKETWLTKSYNSISTSYNRLVILPDIISKMQSSMIKVFDLLLQSKIDIRRQDDNGNTFLHLAVCDGIITFIQHVFRSLISFGYSPNDILDLIKMKNKMGRTTLHFAAIYGHVEVLKLLIEYGGSIHVKDNHNISIEDILKQSGSSISSMDVLQYFNITQEKTLINQIESSSVNGKWDSKRLEEFKDGNRCDIDHIHVSDINSEMLFIKYLATNTPVLISGILQDEWFVCYFLCILLL